MKHKPEIKFKAAILSKLKKKLDFDILTFKNLSKGQVLVKINYSSICRSQLMEIDGLRNNKKFLPHLLGHEGFGEIISTAHDVKKFKKGDKVIIGWIKNNNKDYKGFKLKSSSKKKVINSGCVTTFSNLSIISENRLTKKPKKMKPIEASFYGCAVPTGAGMVINQLKPKPKDKILLIGLGAVGLCALAALKALKIKDVCIFEKNLSRAKLAKKMGYNLIINPKKKENLNKVKKKYINGFDACIESAGFKDTIELGFSMINSNYGKLIFASHPIHGEKISLDPHELIKGKKIYGSWGGNCVPKKDIPKFYKLFEKNNIQLSDFLNKIYKFENINKAINDFRTGNSIRPIIKMEM